MASLQTFSEDILKKFVEQDITGDVLLSLDDLKFLKKEIGILVFEKRVRVLNAIADLKVSLEKAKAEAVGQGKKKDKEPLTPAASQFSGSGGGSVDGRSLTPVGSYDSLPVDKRDSAGAGQKESVRRRLFGRSGGGESLSLKDDTGSKRSSTKEPLSATSSAHFMQDDGGHPIILQGPPSLASPKPKKGTGSIDSGGVGLGLRVVHSRKNSFEGSIKKEHLSSAHLGPLPKQNPTKGSAKGLRCRV
ncbi:hypothetical protein DL96DRAFT_885093 [Flagelloscypha sp. PMI_526]|nr:hypothetical protein DL96DRAFT_885093 [Flagelloscypha sp. PMI_526]